MKYMYGAAVYLIALQWCVLVKIMSPPKCFIRFYLYLLFKFVNQSCELYIT